VFYFGASLRGALAIGKKGGRRKRVEILLWYKRGTGKREEESRVREGKLFRERTNFILVQNEYYKTRIKKEKVERDRSKQTSTSCSVMTPRLAIHQCCNFGG
jgi:hypothetical protein